MVIYFSVMSNARPRHRVDDHADHQRKLDNQAAGDEATISPQFILSARSIQSGTAVARSWPQRLQCTRAAAEIQRSAETGSARNFQPIFFTLITASAYSSAPAASGVKRAPVWLPSPFAPSNLPVPRSTLMVASGKMVVVPSSLADPITLY
jgi:hypothetical protein